MLSRKEEDKSLMSLPITRVNSSQQLSHNGLHGSHLKTTNSYVSIPPSPSNITSASQRQIPVGNKIGRRGIRTDKSSTSTIGVLTKIDDFETALKELSFKVSTYSTEDLPSAVENLLHINDEILHEIDNLQEQQRLGARIETLSDASQSLRAKTKEILKGLIESRNRLRKLPKLLRKNEQSTSEYTSDVDVEVEELLKYAQKLSKFTKAPNVSISLPFQVHPNNYVWPAEDALRRGMLALSSLKENEILKSELDEDEDLAELDSSEDIKKAPASPVLETNDVKQEPSITDEPVKEDQSNTLDMDLFDPDAEDFSE
ncbi:Piso0_003578 [Millerozyma farinosa CBS 7064]|uniref:Mediator of RNA polymerase II transcription subunit 4 n=1 Tax=Pichia sorbitophila (strain ATCC MYA-4447 / BCRC 22081 / CBS 7064 / NBRC 10061 / NRRL Y-12695) TaxID=559304 RepID=G8YJG6_PICSO|nr:Piso0_003578 [Millerozyma farinosa CBS 7064]CCE81226.1 Piso0_003578 [Millerozyma farinosa CBS 7064]